MIAAVLVAQLCAAATPGGVVVSEGRGAFGAVLAARSGGVLVAWQENGPRPPPSEGGPPGWRPLQGYARTLDPATLAPRGAAELFTEEGVFYAHMTGLAAAATAGGAAVASCQCFGGTGRISCLTHTFDAFPAIDLSRAQGGCSGGIALAAAGAQGVLAFTDSAELYVGSSRDGRVHATSEGATADRLAMTTADGARAVLAWRSGDGNEDGARSVFATTVDEGGRMVGRAVELSAAPGRVGAPAVAWVGGAALVTYARAASARAPWRLTLATWTPGRRHAIAPLRTGRAPAVAPSIVASRAAGCAVLSWTEGSGRGTVVRAGRVCNGALDPRTVAQVSRAGVEAGDSELATDGQRVFIVWQEVPAGRGAPAELRVARLGCE